MNCFDMKLSITMTPHIKSPAFVLHEMRFNFDHVLLYGHFTILSHYASHNIFQYPHVAKQY